MTGTVFGTRLSAQARKAISPTSYQEILLELYEAHHESRPVYQSCLAPGVPPATAHRHAARLEALGAVARIPDPIDQRRQNVVLTHEMRTVLDQLMDAVEDASREHGASGPP